MRDLVAKLLCAIFRGGIIRCLPRDGIVYAVINLRFRFSLSVIARNRDLFPGLSLPDIRLFAFFLCRRRHIVVIRSILCLSAAFRRFNHRFARFLCLNRRRSVILPGGERSEFLLRHKRRSLHAADVSALHARVVGPDKVSAVYRSVAALVCRYHCFLAVLAERGGHARDVAADYLLQNAVLDIVRLRAYDGKRCRGALRCRRCLCCRRDLFRLCGAHARKRRGCRRCRRCRALKLIVIVQERDCLSDGG